MSATDKLKARIKEFNPLPGVYRMLDAEGEVLYVGKAVNLRARVSSYFRAKSLSPRIHSMMSKVADIQITVTHTEAEALLLESNLIKQLKPRYNVILRDDKSYPFIFVSSKERYPRLAFDRGKQQGDGRYFGPYPSTTAVRETLAQLQKLFRIRQCEDSFFRNRSRPCLQYQIKRCTAPCVGLIDEKGYAEDLQHALLFLQGRSDEIIQLFLQRMDKASEKQDYEAAMWYRDQIKSLRAIFDKQAIDSESGNLDVIACTVQGGNSCVQTFFIRGGRHLGNKLFFPRTPDTATREEVLQAYISQFYVGHEIPRELLVNAEIADKKLIASMLSARAGFSVSIVSRSRGKRARMVQMAQTNAENALSLRLSSRQSLVKRFEDLQQQLQLDAIPERLECFDISHTRGEATVASCVVFDQNGPVKSDYRRFNIQGITAGDDYAAMHQALERRYTRLKKGEGKLPDVLFIDGGKGQVSQAVQVLEELQIDSVAIVGVAKGPNRIPGQEKLILPGGKKEWILPETQPALHLIQQIRDEAHRFAIAGHRAKRQKTRDQSPLESIPGLGPKRRQILLKNFGGWQGVTKAGIDDLAGVKGIGPELARQIYATLHQTR
ncbi:MAG: excinuclease ABC subunit UvrC [Gammaproteobacteria bacterium]|nr:excinuclease ABC subunit UvrC [Gammaproteobacteria bacterium]